MGTVEHALDGFQQRERPELVDAPALLACHSTELHQHLHLCRGASCLSAASKGCACVSGRLPARRVGGLKRFAWLDQWPQSLHCPLSAWILMQLLQGSLGPELPRRLRALWSRLLNKLGPAYCVQGVQYHAAAPCSHAQICRSEGSANIVISLPLQPDSRWKSVTPSRSHTLKLSGLKSLGFAVKAGTCCTAPSQKTQGMRGEAWGVATGGSSRMEAWHRLTMPSREYTASRVSCESAGQQT